MRRAVATLKEAAEFYRLAIACGILEPADAIRWADSVILEGSDPDIEIIEVASAMRANAVKMMDRLAEIRGRPNLDRVVGLVVALAGRLYRRGEIDILDAGETIGFLGYCPESPEDLRYRLLLRYDEFRESWDGYYYLDREGATALLGSLLDEFAPFEPELSTILPEGRIESPHRAPEAR
jgi:hypothetical protein